MADLDLAAIVKRAEEADVRAECASGLPWVMGDAPTFPVMMGEGEERRPLWETWFFRDVDFIVHARVDVPALTADVLALVGVVNDLHATLEQEMARVETYSRGIGNLTGRILELEAERDEARAEIRRIEAKRDPDGPNAAQFALAAGGGAGPAGPTFPADDQETELLARFIHDAQPPTTLTFDQLVTDISSMRRVVDGVLAEGSADSLAKIAHAALALMRAAHRRGEAEMRERAAVKAAEYQGHSVLADQIRALPLTEKGAPNAS